MTEGKKRKVHSAEFKAKVGLEAARGMKTINEIGQRYEVHPVGGQAVEEGDSGARGDAIRRPARPQAAGARRGRSTVRGDWAAEEGTGRAQKKSGP
ncbi:hypothetical protein ACPUBP_15230 [Methylococcus capsulatus]|uniref:hypothetical protein n=1 Tax=Methylococcus capsulatus TaxID=414 RepID=UPI002A6451DD|nr:hypothetical protein [Methylococcus capsulatus]